jgi:hypothetical protein
MKTTEKQRFFRCYDAPSDETAERTGKSTSAETAKPAKRERSGGAAAEDRNRPKST